MNDVLGEGWKLLLIDIGVAIFAISVGIIAIVGTVFALIYTAIETIFKFPA